MGLTLISYYQNPDSRLSPPISSGKTYVVKEKLFGFLGCLVYFRIFIFFSVWRYFGFQSTWNTGQTPYTVMMNATK